MAPLQCLPVSSAGVFLSPVAFFGASLKPVTSLSFLTYHLVNMSPRSTSLALTAAANAIVGKGVKLAVNQDRPDGGKYGMPSSHACSVSFIVSSMFLLGEISGKLTAVLGVYGALGLLWRVQTCKHSLLQIVLGATLGFANALITWRTKLGSTVERSALTYMGKGWSIWAVLIGGLVVGWRDIEGIVKGKMGKDE